MRKRSVGINVRVSVTEKKNGDDVGSEVRVKMLEKQVKAIAALSAMAVPFLSVIGRILGERLLGVVIAFCRSCRYAL